MKETFLFFFFFGISKMDEFENLEIHKSIKKSFENLNIRIFEI